MADVPRPIRLPSAVRDKTASVRLRGLSIGALHAFVVGAILLVSGMLFAMGSDWLISPADHRWRFTVTFVVLLAAVGALVRRISLSCAGHYRLLSAARRIDRCLPFLEERWLAAAELTACQDPPVIRGSDQMVRQVLLETESLAHLVSPQAVVPAQPVRRGLRWLSIPLGILLLMLVLSPQATMILMERFWRPGADISLTRLERATGSRVVARGEPLSLTVETQGRPRRNAILTIRPDNSNSGQATPGGLPAGEPHASRIVLNPAANTPNLFSHRIDNVQQPFSYRFRAGDGSTGWYHITPHDRPALERVHFQVTFPEYTDLPAETLGTLPRYHRILEGSLLEIVFTPTTKLAAFQLQHSGRPTESLTESTPGSYLYTSIVREDDSITPILVAKDGLTNQAIPSCRLVTYRDNPPSVDWTWPNSDLVVKPDEKISLEFTANDDLGVARAELLVTVDPEAQAEAATTQPASAAGDPVGRPQQMILPIPLGEQQHARQVHSRVELDLKALGLKTGQQLSCIIRVSDGRFQAETNSSAPAGSVCDSAAGSNESASTSRRDEQAVGSSFPPAHPMTKRILDVPGQCCSSPCRIRVDEWAGSYKGQIREKKQIAIDNYLKRLDEQLRAAQSFTTALLEHVRKTDTWAQAESVKLLNARQHLDEASRLTAELQHESSGTPYALIGLQLADISVSHVMPARQRLIDAQVINRAKRSDVIDQAAFHIRQARERLADLTHQYEAVKKDQNQLEAIEQLARMHQLFVEDMQILLGACKPTLNPRDGRWRLIPDEMAGAILKRIEDCIARKKALADELARILAKDPALLRCYMAMTRKQADTLRDQLTILSQRQTQQRDSLKEWFESSGARRDQVVSGFRNALLSEQTGMAVLAAQLYDAMETWPPSELSHEKGDLAQCIQISSTLARTAREVPRLLATGETEAGIRYIRDEIIPMLTSLQDRLASLERADSTPAVLRFVARRVDEITRLLWDQEDWIKKAGLLGTGQFQKAVAVDQDRLIDATNEFADKINGQAMLLRNSCSGRVGDSADQLTDTLFDQVIPHQADAAEALEQGKTDEGRSAQDSAVEGMALAEKHFDALLDAVEAFLAERPFSSPADRAAPKPMEEMLADLISSLQEESDACEKLGAVIRSNIQIQGDWIGKGSNNGSGGGTGQGRSASRNLQSAPARLKSAAAQARACNGGVNRRLADLREQRDRFENRGAGGVDPPESKLEGRLPAEHWDQLASKLGNALRQGRDSAPPEQYRAAIDAYFSRVAVGATFERPATDGTAD